MGVTGARDAVGSGARTAGRAGARGQRRAGLRRPRRLHRRAGRAGRLLRGRRHRRFRAGAVPDRGSRTPAAGHRGAGAADRASWPTACGRRPDAAERPGDLALPATIPSPAQGVWRLGPLPVRAYALCILIGIALAVWIASKRWRARGGADGIVLDISAWAVPFGIIGARIYHVATTWQPYFGHGRPPAGRAEDLERRPGHLGRRGRWCAGRLDRLPAQGRLVPDVRRRGRARRRGRPGRGPDRQLLQQRDLRRPDRACPGACGCTSGTPSAGEALRDADGHPVLLPGAYHPTFLYEALWCLFVAGASCCWTGASTSTAAARSRCT